MCCACTISRSVDGNTEELYKIDGNYRKQLHIKPVGAKAGKRVLFLDIPKLPVCISR